MRAERGRYNKHMSGTAPQPGLNRPSPRLAWWLSALLPGAGQAYLGQLWLAPLFCAAWIVSIFGMLDVLTTFRHSPYQLLFGACAILLGGGAWILSTFLARRRAERMTAHGAVCLWIARKPLLRYLFLREWSDLLLAFAFTLLTIGYFSKARPAQVIGTQVMWWWPYEILGTLFLVIYQGFLEGFSHKLSRPIHRLTLLSILFGVLAILLHLQFKFSMTALAISGLIILPGFVPILTFGTEKDRVRFLYRAGRAFCTLFLSLFPVAFLASLLEGSGVRAAGRSIFEGSVMIFWGAAYFALRAFFEALNYHAAVSLGEGRDPRWGG